MGFPENVLTRNEKVVRSIHPHWLTVFGPALVGLILVAAAIFASWATPNDSKGNWIQWISVAVAVLIGIPVVIVPFLRWRTTHYVVTDHRVMVRRGILSKAGKDITLSKITDVSFQQTFLDRVIRAGTLNIESAGDSADELLKNIPHSDVVQQLINHLIDQDANARAGRLLDGRRESPVSRDAGDGGLGGATAERPSEDPVQESRE
jgi:uncharacterized membrane protein YdbT with pleckstrin-like domain